MPKAKGKRKSKPVEVVPNPAALRQDAANRAARSLLQGIAIDVAVAVSFVVYDAMSSESPDWRLLGLSVLRTALQAVASYVMRIRSGVLLPPKPQPEPTTTTPEP